MAEELTGTKEQLFDIALEMFADRGYENVPLQDIAKAAGIKTPSIYYHFPSKEDILDSILQYFTEHFFDAVKSAEEIYELVETGTFLEIINAATWTFGGSPPKIQKRMTLILKIIYMRIMLRDEKVNKIFTEVIIKENWKRAEKIIDYGITIGKIRPDLDKKALFEVLLFTRLFTGIVGLSDDYTGGEIAPKSYLNDFIAQLLEAYHKNNGNN